MFTGQWKGERKMFYAKEKLGESAELAVELTEENVYCKCPVCGRS